MLWIDGVDEVLGRRAALDSIYVLLTACHLQAQSTAAGSLAGIAGAWCKIVSFLLVPRPCEADRLRIPKGRDDMDWATVAAALSGWAECIGDRVAKERSLSEEWAADGWEHQNITASMQAELLFTRDQYNRAGLLLDQLNLPESVHALEKVLEREGGFEAAATVLRSKSGLQEVHQEALDRSRSLSLLLAG